MGIVAKNSSWSAIYSYAGVVLGAFNVIFLFTEYFSQAEYGLTRALFSIASISAQFFSFGSGSLLIRFIPEYRNTINQKKFIRLLTYLCLIGFVLFILSSLLFKSSIVAYYSGRSPLLNEYLFAIIPLVFGLLFFNYLDAYARAYLSVSFATFLNDFLYRFVVCVLALLYVIELLTFQSFVLLFANVHFFLAILLAVHILKNKRFKTVETTSSDKELAYSNIIKNIGYFGLFTIISSLASIAITNIDNIILSSLLDLERVGVYSFGLFISSVIVLPERIMNKSLFTVINEFVYENNWDEVEKVYKKTATVGIWLGGFIFALIATGLSDLLYYKAEYNDSSDVFLLLGLGQLIHMSFGANSAILMASKYYKFNALSIVILVFLLIVTDLIFIPQYDIQGAAFATCLSLILFNILKASFIYFKFKIQPFNKNFFTSLAIFSLLYVVGTKLSFNLHPIVELISKCSIIGILYIGINYFLHTSEDINKLITSVYTKIRP